MDILKRPMFLAAVSCSLISIISLFLPFLAIVVTVAIIILLFYINVKNRYRYIAVFASVILFVFAILFEFAKIQQIEIKDGNKIEGRFIVAEEAVDHGEYFTVILKEKKCNSLPKNSKLLSFDYKKTDVKPGDIIDATVEIDTIGRYNKYRLSNYSDSIYATANIEKISIIENKSLIHSIFGEIRFFAKRTVSSLLDGDEAGLLLAITTGDKSLLSDKFLDNVKTTGISHIIVVSGMHLSIIICAILFCVDRIFYNKYIRCIISIFFVTVIYFICGSTMSITRAGLMFIIATIAPIFNRENDYLNSILTSITFVLIASPFAIFNVSFLLSVLSTLSTIWVVPFYYRSITERFNISSKFLKSILVSVLCSVFAIVFTLPVTIKLFGYVSIVAPISNLIINFPVTVGLIFNIIALLISSVPYIKIISFPFYFIAKYCSKFTVAIINTIAKLPITVAVLPKSAFWWCVLLIVLIIGLMYYYEFKRKEVIFDANNI